MLENEREPDQDESAALLALLIGDYLDEVAKKRRTFKRARLHLSYVLAYFGAIHVGDLTTEKQWEFINDLGQGMTLAMPNENDDIEEVLIGPQSVSSIVIIMKTLQACLNYGKTKHRIRSFPAILTRAESIADALDTDLPRARQRVLTIEEMAMLVEWAPHEHMKRFVLCAINTAARPEAILDLTYSQIDFQHRIIDLNPPARRRVKNKRRPIIPMTHFLENALEQWHDHKHVIHWRGERVNRVKDGIKRLARCVGLEGVSQYTIRHTMATWLRSQGVPKWEVKGFLGHADEDITDGYAKFDPTHQSNCRLAIDAYMEQLEKLVDRPLFFQEDSQNTPKLTLKRARG